MTYPPVSDHRAQFDRRNDMVTDPAIAVAALHEAVGEIASATDNPKLQAALDARRADIAKRVEDVVAAMQREDAAPR